MDDKEQEQEQCMDIARFMIRKKYNNMLPIILSKITDINAPVMYDEFDISDDDYENENSLMHVAFGRGNIDSVLRLLDANADIYTKDINRNTPFHLIKKSKSEHVINQIMQILFELNVDLYIKNNNGLSIIDILKIRLPESYLETILYYKSPSRFHDNTRHIRNLLLEKEKDCAICMEPFTNIDNTWLTSCCYKILDIDCANKLSSCPWKCNGGIYRKPSFKYDKNISKTIAEYKQRNGLV